MLRRVVLHGSLKELHQGEIAFEVDTVSEAVRACYFQIEGFREEITNGCYKVYLQEVEDGNDIDESVLSFNLGNYIDTIHIIPDISGAKGGGGKIILGIAMIALAVVTWGSSLTLMGGQVAIAGGGVSTAAGTVLSTAVIGKLGVAMVLGGVSQMLAPEVDSGSSSDYENVDQKPSYLFNGPVNTSTQGAPIPLVYGRLRVGSHVVSSGLTTENV